MASLLLLFITVIPACVFCRPTTTSNPLQRSKSNVEDKLYIGGYQSNEKGVGTKFTVLLQEKLNQEEKRTSIINQDRSGSSNSRSRRGRSLFFKLCVRYRGNRCVRKKRFGFWHSYRRGGTPNSS